MKGHGIPYTADELAWVKVHCTRSRREAHAEFVDLFERNDVSLIHFNSLCKRNGWLTGRTGQYDPGSVPANKGKKMPFNANSARTPFKKGSLPHNTKFLGHERVSKDGYTEISIGQENPHTGYERRYVLKHKYLWEKENGPVPPGMLLKSKDGNRLNTDPSNWALISRGALPFLNGHRGPNYDAAPAELKPVVLTLAKLRYAKSAKARGER